MSATADAIREALIADGFDRPAYDELVTHNPSALTDRECGAVLAWALLGEVDRLTTQAALDAAALTTPEVYVGVVSAAVEEEIGRLRRQRDEALADLAALRLEHEAHKILLTCARRDRDEARGANIQAVKDNVSPSASVDVLDETVAGLKAQRDEARRECDDARDETTRLWDATKADRARMAELESRPTYEDGIKAAAAVMRAATVDSADSVVAVVDAIFPRVLALLEPKP